MYDFMELKDVIDRCKTNAQKKGEVCLYMEDVLIEFFCTQKLPKYLSKYKYKILSLVEKLHTIKNNRIEAQVVANCDFKSIHLDDGEIYFHPTIYDFFQVYSMIESNMVLVEFKDPQEKLYSLIILTIFFSQDLMLKSAFDAAGLTDKIIRDIQDHAIKCVADMSQTLNNVLHNSLVKMLDDEFPDDDSFQVLPGIRITKGGRPADAEIKSYLETYCTNLTNVVQSKGWSKLIGRENELKEIEEVLLRKDKPNAILVGEAGIGKTKIVQGFAKQIAQKKCHDQFKDYEVWELNILELTSGTIMHGQFEERVNGIIKEIQQKQKVILYIDEIHNIKNDNDNVMDIAEMMKPILSTGEVRIIGSTTEEEYRRSIGKDVALERRFKTIHIKEPTTDETITILKGIKGSYEKYHKVSYGLPIIKQVVDLSEKYLVNRRFPDKAIELLDTIGAYCRSKNIEDGYKVSSDDVNTIVSRLANLPKITLETSEIERMKTLGDKIKEKIVGQDTAIDSLLDGVMISKSGLRERNKTALTLFFKGPSGVGKTETVKQLAENLNIPLFRYDMSEYMEEHTVSKLIGTPPGYVGYENGRAGSGLLVNQVKANPYCIVLLDEIEKANSKVLNVFLQVMDNGKLTSSSGNEADFSNVFLFMTSNVGATASHKMASIGFGADKDKNASDEFFNSSFSPEFRNRLDGAISFNNLSNEVMSKITNNELDELKKILATKKVKLSYDTLVVDYISRKASEENLGARPIKRIIHNEIKNIISKEIVYGKLAKGGKLAISIDEQNRLKFKY